MKRHRLVLLDLDGTVYRGNEPTPHAAETLAELRRRNVHLRFLTNNSGVTPQSVSAKLQAMGIECAASEVLTSGHAARAVLSERGHRRLFVVGEPGLIQVLASGEAGFEIVNRDGEGLGPEAAGQADAVLVGICRSFTYAWLDAALQQILGGARFYATNRDATYPLEGGRVQPGAGSLVASVATACGMEPETLGKPSPFLARLAMEALGVQPDETLMVGDREDTDILCGRNARCDVHMVLCGVTPSAPEGVPFSEDLRGLLG